MVMLFEKYRLMVDKYNTTHRMKKNYYTMEHLMFLEDIENHYWEVEHLVNMLHEIENKYGINSTLDEPYVEELTSEEKKELEKKKDKKKKGAMDESEKGGKGGKGGTGGTGGKGKDKKDGTKGGAPELTSAERKLGLNPHNIKPPLPAGKSGKKKKGFRMKEYLYHKFNPTPTKKRMKLWPIDYGWEINYRW
ncbi:hypothetical protein B5X24_HaOG211290 [Helicoverpa armigera]|uniref:Uncharacterized protein n=2 Tax=Helicoverpa armigera TaxID=29058 RepID=A0A2W1B9S4_HELAM|nr:hypothetical protein B5X24_HaOG211290 [Helicoverpa armigera]